MTLTTKIRPGIFAVLGLLILAALAACLPATPGAEPTATAAPTEQPTATLAPSETPAPTETPAASPTPSGDAAGTPASPVTTLPAQPTAANPGAGSPPADKYEYLGQDIADQTQVLPNRTLTITWTVKNAGTTGWTKEYALRHFSGPKPDKDIYYFSKDVPAGGTINFTVTFTTPADPGTYDMWFKLTNAAGQNFGDLDLVYVVSNNPVKATAAPTAAQ